MDSVASKNSAKRLVPTESAPVDAIVSIVPESSSAKSDLLAADCAIMAAFS
jgi:hypothetical protein